MSEPSCEFDPIDDLADAFLERYRRGERPSLSEFTAKHPELAERIRASLSRSGGPRGDRRWEKPGAGLDVGPLGSAPRSRGVWVSSSSFAASARAVWESFTRPSTNRSRAAWCSRSCTHGSAPIGLRAAIPDRGRSAAKLHHTNIVPVFDYGEQDGVFYYAMQYIAGVGLERVLEDVRRLRSRPAPKSRRRKPSVRAVGDLAGADPLTAISRGLLTGRVAEAPMAPLVAEPGSTAARYRWRRHGGADGEPVRPRRE